MTAQLSPAPVFKAFNNDGTPLAGGLLYSYTAGTTTPQATYIDSTQSTPNLNPIVLNARGECALWLNPTLGYKFLLTDSLGNTIPGWPVDNITGALSSGNIIPSVTNSFTLGSPTFSWANLYLGPNNSPALDTATGNIGYVARTNAEISAAVVPVDFSYQPFDIRRYGGDPTGVSASDTALASVISVCGTNGGTITFPPGVFNFAGQIGLNVKRNIILQGSGGRSAGAATATIIQYTGTVSSVFINLNSSIGCSIRDCQIEYNQASWGNGTNTLIGCNNDGTNGDPAYNSLVNCLLGSSLGTGGAVLVDINKCIDFYFENCSFIYGNPAIRGVAVGGGGYSNVVTVKGCSFNSTRNVFGAVYYPGESWSFIGCDFEASATGTACGILGSSTVPLTKGLSITGCWFGDVTLGGSIWCTLYGNGISICGNRFGGFTTTYAISLNSCNGVLIAGNSFDTFTGGIDFTTATITGVSIVDNYFTGVTTALTTTTNAPANLVFNPNSPLIAPPAGLGKAAINGYSIDANGIVEQWGSATVTIATPLAVTFATNGIAYPNAVWNMQATLVSPSALTDTVSLSSISTTGFTLNVAGTAGTSVVYWRARGN
jgi:hypothetical protein